MHLLLLLPLLWRGTISQNTEYGIHVQKTVTVQEGLCVSIPCSFYYPQQYTRKNTAYGYWYYIDSWQSSLAATNDPQASVHTWARGRFHLTGDPQRDNCSLRITRAQKNDHGSYSFWVKKGNMYHGYRTNVVSIQVDALTQKPKVHIPEILKSGHQANLTCTVPGACREGTPFTLLWTGAALSSRGSALLNTSKLLFTPQSLDHGTTITCQVTFPEAYVSTERTVQLRVTYPPQNVNIGVSWANKTGLELLGNTSSLQVLEGESLTLVCTTDSNPPATLTWTYRSQVLRSSDSGVLHLELSKLGPKDRGEYTCQAQHPLGTQQHSMRVCVQTCSCYPTYEENGSWPLIFTLLRGALMGISFLLTYGLTWLYYTCQINQPLDTVDKREMMDLYSVPAFYGPQDVSKI